MPSPTFVLAEEVDELAFDFTPHGADPKSGPHGTIEEPSSAQLQIFTKALRHLVSPMLAQDGKTAEDAEKMAPADIAARLAEADEDEEHAAETLHGIVAAVSDLCSGSPSVEQIEGLSFRGQQAFFGWIVGTFLDPKLQTPATS